MKKHYEHVCVAPIRIKVKKARTEQYNEPEKVEMTVEFRFVHGNSHTVEHITEKEALKLYRKLQKHFHNL